MSKGIAVSTVLKFLLGLLVLVIVAFLVYRIFYAPPLTEQECRMRMTSWCSSCTTMKWASTITMDLDLKKCGNRFGYFTLADPTTAINCGSSDDNAKSFKTDICSKFLP